MSVFTVSDLEKQAQSVKIDDGTIWVNLTDGRFMRLDTCYTKQPIYKTSAEIYPRVRVVMYNRSIIAKKRRNEQLLKRTLTRNNKKQAS